MKQISKFTKTLSLFLFSLLSTFAAVAQEEGASLDINVNSNSGGAFYTQIWFWVIAGLVFILLLVALLRGGGGSKQNIAQKNDFEKIHRFSSMVFFMRYTETVPLLPKAQSKEWDLLSSQTLLKPLQKLSNFYNR